MNRTPFDTPSPQPQPESSNTPWYATPQAPKISYSTMDGLFAWLSLLLGFLTIRALPISRYPLGGMLVLVLLFAFGGVYLRVSGIRAERRAILIALLSAILSVGMLTNGNHTIQFCVFLFLTLVFFCWIYDLCGLAGKKLSPDSLFSHLLCALFRSPWKHFGALFPAMGSIGKQSARGRRFWQTLGWIALGLLCAVVPTAVIALLLSYDSQFTSLLKDLFSFSWDGFGEFLGDAILSIPAAILFFGGLFAVKRQREQQKENSSDAPPISFAFLRILPRALLCAAVTPVLILYVLFFISQWSYYVSAFTHVLPEGLTYAAYARDGFFQLCAVCAINAVMLWVFHVMARRSPSGRGVIQRIYSGLISVFTLILISTALSKMILYIGTYGLTQKRVYASWAMLVLAVIFIAVLLRQIFRRFPTAPTVLIATVALFALIALPNVDGVIASYNVNHYLSGDLTEMDVYALEDLGVSAVPAAIKLEKELSQRNTPDKLTDEERTILYQTSAYLNAITVDLRVREEKQNGVERIFSFSIPTARARALLEEREN